MAANGTICINFGKYFSIGNFEIFINLLQLILISNVFSLF